MSLKDALECAVVQRGPLCSVRDLIADLPEADQAVLVEAFADPGVQTNTIHRALRAEYPERSIPAASTLQRHRKRGCGCPL